MLFRKHAQRMLPILVGVALLAPLTPARAQRWIVETVEEDPNDWNLGWALDSAFDPDGNPAICYESLAYPGVIGLAHFNGLAWDFEGIMDIGDVSLAYSPLGAPSVTGTRAQPQAGLYFATKSGGAWNSTRLDTSVTYDRENPLLYDNEGNPAVSWRSNEKKRPGLTVARRNSRGVWTKQLVDPGMAGAHISMALDPAGNLAIAYAHSSVIPFVVPDTVKFARWNGSSWDIEIAGSGPRGYGRHADLAYDPLTGRPSVAFGVGDRGPVAFLQKTASGSWEYTDNIDPTASNGNCSLKYTPDGTAWLAYVASVNDPVVPYPVRVARRDASSGVWTIETVDPSATQCFSVSLDIDGNGNLGLAYRQWTTNAQGARVKFARRQEP